MTTNINDYSAAKDALTRLVTDADRQSTEFDHLASAMLYLSYAERGRMESIQNGAAQP